MGLVLKLTILLLFFFVFVLFIVLLRLKGACCRIFTCFTTLIFTLLHLDFNHFAVISLLRLVLSLLVRATGAPNHNADYYQYDC